VGLDDFITAVPLTSKPPLNAVSSASQRAVTISKSPSWLI